jgi:hypothetical protein
MENFSLEEYNALKASGVKFNFSEENLVRRNFRGLIYLGKTLKVLILKKQIFLMQI